MLTLFLLSLAAAADPQPKLAANSPDKVICRTFSEIGSLIAKNKVCKTKREWDREREDLRASGPGVDSCRNTGNGGPC